jgi:hypothetical protein
LLALTLDESLDPSKVKKIKSLTKLVNPFSFFTFFRQSKGLAGMGSLLAGWQLAGRKMLPVKNFQKLRFGWGVQEQANFAVVYQLSELVKPLLLPTMVRQVGGGNLRAVAKTDRCIDSLIWLLHALSPAGNYAAAVLQAFQHGDPCVEKVIATEAERVGAGQGEMFAAQQNVEFVARLVMPWVYGELFARAVSFSESGGTGPLAFVGLPFVLAAVLDLCTAQIAVPLAWNCLGFEPTWSDSGDPGAALLNKEQPRSAEQAPEEAEAEVEAGEEERSEVRGRGQQLSMTLYYRDTARAGAEGGHVEPSMLEVYMYSQDALDEAVAATAVSPSAQEDSSATEQTQAGGGAADGDDDHDVEKMEGEEEEEEEEEEEQVGVEVEPAASVAAAATTVAAGAGTALRSDDGVEGNDDGAKREDRRGGSRGDQASETAEPAAG